MIKLFGVDISEHNGSVDFVRMKKDGVKFVMLRSSWGHFVEDKKVRENVTKCKAANLPYGFYHYSYASNDAEAYQEAKSFLTLCKTLGGYTYPLNLDMEDADGWKTKNGVTDAQNLRTILIFKNVIEGAGEYMTLYMSKSWFDRLQKLDKTLIDSIDPWLAHWGIKEPSMSCGMWQYSSDGIVDGSSKRTDVNWSYKDYPSILASMSNDKSSEKTDSIINHSIRVGEVVKIKKDAKCYVTGETIPSWVKTDTYTVLKVSQRNVLLKEIMSWVKLSDLQKIEAKLSVGQHVKIKQSADCYATGEQIPSWVKDKTYTILQIDPYRKKALLKEIMSWVYYTDIK